MRECASFSLSGCVNRTQRARSKAASRVRLSVSTEPDGCGVIEGRGQQCVAQLIAFLVSPVWRHAGLRAPGEAGEGHGSLTEDG